MGAPEWLQRSSPSWTAWKVAGAVLAGLVALAGLVLLGFVIVVYVSLSSLGSNK